MLLLACNRENNMYMELTNEQNAVYDMEEFYGGSIATISGRISFHSSMDVQRAEYALNKIVECNSIMQTKIDVDNGNRRLRYYDYELFKVPIIEVKTKEELHKWIAAEAKKEFPRDGKLYKFAFLKCDHVISTIFFKIHHLISDVWSVNLFANWFFQVYENPNCELPSFSYSEKLKQDAIYQNSEKYIKDKDYWLKKCCSLEEPVYIANGKTHNCKAARMSFKLDLNFVKVINSYCKEEKVTPFNFIMGALAILLFKIKNKNEFCIGTTMLNRKGKIERNTMGVYTNEVPMFFELHNEYLILDFLKNVRDEIYNTMRHQKYNYNQMLSDVRNVKRNQERLFDIIFNYQNANVEVSKDADVEWIHNGCQGNALSIHVNDRENSGSLFFDYDYNVNLLDEWEVEYFHKRVLRILELVALHKVEKVMDIDCIPEDERNMILETFNHRALSKVSEKTIVQLFEEQVERSSENKAVVYEGESLTYRELNEKANQVALVLRKLGVKQDDKVAIVVARGLDMIVAIYGVIKSGGAYVPVDPGYPEERIHYMIKDSESKAVVLAKAELSFVPEVPVVDLQDANIYKTKTENPERISNPENLLYVIYTSGTTGKPKGVMVEQKGVVNLCDVLYEKVFSDYSNTVNVALISNYVFDASIKNIFTTLLNGHTLHIISDTTKMSDIESVAYFRNHNIAVSDGTPIFLQLISDKLGEIPSLSKMLIGGEELSCSLLKKVFQAKEEISIFNVYGPTETTVDAAIYPCTVEDIEKQHLPIGKPVNNVQIYIMNGDNLSGIGLPGELCVAGCGVARGYLNHPELTEKKFVKNPFDKGKMYRTGDLARWLPDGNIEYLGRIDEQVKIRGFRIELGEIENQLQKIDFIKDAAVVVRAKAEGDKDICAYYVAGEEVSIATIKEELSKELPYYMVPTKMMQIDRLPVTVNGKVDKRALPEIKLQSDWAYMAPRNKTEEKLCGVFQEVLGIEEVGIQDNFFELGGHSLRATRAMNRIEAELGVRLPIKTIFEHPTVEGIEMQMEQQAGEKYCPIEKAEEKEYYPMSSAQKRMFMLHEIGELGSTYNMPAVIEIEGNLNISNVKSAAKALVERHESLRTSFRVIKGEAVQIIEHEVSMTVEYEEIKYQSKEEVLLDFVKPFDLGHAPLMRMKVVRTETGKYMILFDMHHIISDGMSVGILLNEFSRLYKGEELPKLRVQYKDYSEWMAKRDLGKQREYWLKEFSGEIPMLELPLDYSRPQTQSYRGKCVKRSIMKDTKEAIQVLCRKTGTTEYMVMLSAFIALLGRYSRQEDIVVGTPIAGRTHRDTEAIVGMFVNTLAIRSYPESAKTFKQFLLEMKEKCLKADENQEYPFEELVEEVGVRRDLSRNPLFDVMFVLQNNEKESISLEGTRLTGIENLSNVAKFDLTMNISGNDNGYTVGMEYCVDLFCEENIARMLEHYCVLLEEAVRKPEFKIGEIPILNEEEREMVLRGFNNTAAEYPREKTVVELFEEQVERTPDNIAVVCENESLTYKELNEKANQIAYKLRNLGVKPEDKVAIIAERSLAMIIGIYGIIKSGGAYVPVDPGYPEERIQYMLKDSEPRALLLARTTLSFEKEVPVIDLEDAALYEGECKNLVRVNNPDSLLYVIYTSGTTGRPKGVMNRHTGLINRVLWMDHEYPLSESDVILQKTTFTFDVSVWEILWWGFTGASVVLLPNGDEKDPEAICRVIEKKQVTVMHFVPPMLQTFLAYLSGNQTEAQKLRTLKYVFSSGSALHKKQESSFMEYVSSINPNVKLINVYGPTEASIDVTYFACEGESEQIPIGRPIWNTQIYIQNGKELCGIGMPGELCIAGAGVAKGYLNRPQLTAEKFVDNPYGEGKIYRTGDLARWLPDGNLEYLGRMDEQVKIRGFRIELGEIENVLRKTAGIKDAVVIARENSEGDKDIYAYFIAEDLMDIQKIKEALGKELPYYMIPAKIMQIEQIPVTKNGKVDKRALPDIVIEESRQYVAPENGLEVKLCRVFRDILGIEQVGIKDNFFDLGGHSLRATRAINQIEAETGTRLPLKAIFENPTVEGLEMLIERESAEKYCPIEKVEEKEFYPMSSAQKRLFMLHEIGELGYTYNMPAAVEIEGVLNFDRVKHAAEELVKRHECLRTSFHLVEGEAVQKVEKETVIQVEYEENAKQKKEEIISEFIKPFDLGKAPLMRIKVIKKEESKYILLFDMHHIISDGMSVGIIMEEFSRLYAGEELPELRVQYKDYSEWMQKRELGSQRDYWLKEFSGEIPVLELPLDFPRPQIQSYRGEHVERSMSSETRKAMQALCRKTGTTEYMVLLSAAMALLGRYSRQEDIVVGTPISGRTHRDTETMVGMFVNTLAMRGAPAREKSFYKFLLEMKEKCIKAGENQEYPFEELVEEVGVRREVSRNPLFDVMFALQNNEKAKLKLEGAQFAAIESTFNVAKFDLSINVYEKADRFSVEMVYCADLFNKENMERMLEHYCVLVEEAVRAPEKKIGEIQVLSKEEQEKVLYGFNDTIEQYPREKTIVELFEDQVERVPENIAVVYENESLTYSQMNMKVNQVAHKLRSLGIKPEDKIALIAERSLEMIIGIYGIIKSGGVYVPIDPEYPEERIQYILKDCQPKAVILAKSELSVTTKIPVINLDDASIYKGDDQNLLRVNTPENLLYIIYTSGTTGKPKGVMVEQKGVRNLCRELQEKIFSEYKDSVAVALISNYVFDASIQNIFTTLLSGHTLHVISEATKMSDKECALYFGRNKIVISDGTPSYLQFLADRIEEMPSLSKLLIGGEELPNSTLKKIISAKEDIKVYNAYGPTETTVDASVYLCTMQDAEKYHIPIGKPIRNVQMYIMNEMVLCGIGMPGELCIAGAGVARGYLNHSDLTNEKFIKNPYGEGMLYRTGDLVRWQPDGNVEYLGRMDEQVKIHGFRIELGEIENALQKISYIKDVAVIVREDTEGDREIFAYLVSDEEVEYQKVKEELAETLPSYMIPMYMMQIDSIPLTANGKVDKKALPEIILEAVQEYVAPRNEIEEKLCKIYSEILGSAKVGIKDSFFELGGHSLRAIRAINRMEAETGVRLPLKAIFDHPTVEGIEMLMSQQAENSYSPIEKAESREFYPMSSGQKRLFMIHEIGELGSTYNMPAAIAVEGVLNLANIEHAAKELVKRHECLRTSFHLIEGEAVQVIEKDPVMKVEYEENALQNREEILSGFIKPFDLRKAPLMRMKVVKREENRYFLLFDMHHIISDGMSVRIIIDEFSRLYAGEELPELRVQYKDYSEWMRKRDFGKQRNYWLQELSGDIPVLELPLDYTRPQVQSYRGKHMNGSISKETKKAVRKLCNKAGVTEYMVLLSAAMALLGRYSNQEDIIVGTPISGRTHKDTETMVGMFINTLAMRGYPESKKSFMEFLLEMKEKCLKASENQEYPFEQLVEEIGVRRDLSRNPLFDVMFVMQNHEKADLKLKGASLSKMDSSSAVAKVDLTLNVWDSEDGYELGLEYCADLFYEESMEQLLEHYCILLEEAVREPERKIGEIPVLSKKEQEVLLYKFNNTEVEYPRDKNVVELFEEQVRRTPEAIAVVYEEESLTYRELNEKANQVACKLRSLGVKPEDRVVIIAERSLEMIIGIYGIIKSGGAYVPVDPGYPAERIRYILEDSEPKAVVLAKTELSLSTKIPVVNLEDKSNFIGDGQNLDSVNIPENTLYVIFTSGTTGKPKGVMVKHSNMVNYSAKNSLNISGKYIQDDMKTMISVTEFVFDIFATEIILSLLQGMKTIICSRNQLNDVALLCKVIEKENVEVLQTTPSRIKMMLCNKSILEKLEKLKLLLIGGEAFDSAIVPIIRKYSNARLVNVYGPSETTVWSTAYEISSESDHYPIGKPIGNTQIYILKEMTLCGIGMPGELCIAGAGVAKGYLNRPELTKEKFVNNPYGDGLLYRTGDLARWMPDGNLDYLGRIDEQVKIRGYRIELGEIASVLRKREKIKDAVVIARENSEGDKDIYAYLISDEVISTEKIKEELRKELPYYMVPSRIKQIETIPVTVNGKVDKRALPEIELEEKKQYIAPRNEIEEKLCGIFCEILGMKQVGIMDDFFELGGHSLRATRAINRIEAETGVRIKLKAIFENPTVEKLGVLLEQEAVEKYAPIEKAEEKEFYPMSSAQKRLFMLHEIEDLGSTYNMSEAIEIEGALDLARVEYAVKELVKRHECLRTSFHLVEGKAVQVIEKETDVVVEYEKDSSRSTKEILSAFTRPFDLVNAPLMRMGIVKREENRYLLLFDMHHIISDGMSVGIIMEEFSRLYAGEELPELRVQYKDYSEWMEKRDLSDQRAYWLKEFSGEIPVLELPLDYHRPQIQSYRGKRVEGSINSETKKVIQTLCNRTGTTEYMVLLSAAMVLLGRYSRQEDIVVGTPIAARTHKDTERMVGMFVNTLAMRGYPENNKTFKQFLLEMKDKCLKAGENQEYPFEELIEAAGIRRDMSRNPLFDVMFVLQNNEKSNLQLKGVTLERTESTSDVAKFDLTINISEHDDGYTVGMEYCVDLFSEENIEQMLQHYCVLVAEAVSKPEEQIGKIKMLCEEEREQILYGFNDTAAEYPREKTVVELFEEQVERTPESTAVVYKNTCLTYRELNEKANQVAYKLRSLGVKPEDKVAIVAQRSLEMIVGIYGIIKSGGAYVPVDPGYPEERIQYMLEDCKPKAVMLAKAELPFETKLTVINLEDSSLYNGMRENPVRVNTPDSLLYVIYTSGTTGKPKGVMNRHTGLMNRILWMNNEYPIGGSDVILQKTTFTFDVSVWEILWWSFVGARVVLLPNGGEKDPETICDVIEKNQVTVMHFVPPMMQAFLTYLSDSAENHAEAEKLRTLKYIFSSGSALHKNHETGFMNYIRSKNQKVKLINVYGPTEASIDVTYIECKGEYEQIPIGRPIWNTQIYILHQNEICGVGMPGELCIAGVGVAKGYLNRPELTKEKFVDNPYGAGRLYRTGDLARWLPDGNLDYMGRIDEQVKVRGFRIELDEIASVLRKIDYIKDAAVIVRDNAEGDKDINAFVVSDIEVDIRKIREELGKTLPDYMIPLYMMQIEKIPLTQNGKLDKRALPEITIERSHCYVAPRNEIEENLVNAFCDILGVALVGIQDNFFELGGDSIKAIRVVSKMKECGYNVSVRDIMHLQTVERISNVVTQASANSQYEQGEVTGNVPFTPIQKEFRMWNFPMPSHFNQSVMLKVQGRIERKALLASLDELVRHHDALRMVEKEDGLYIKEWKEGELYSWVSYDYRNLPMDEASRMIEKQSNQIQISMNLKRGPLVKVGLYHTKQEDHLLLCMHHIVVDGVSWRIILKDLEDAYQQYRENGKIRLPKKTASYKDWAEALLEYSESKDIKNETEYWRSIAERVSLGKIVDTTPTGAAGTGIEKTKLDKEYTKNLLYSANKSYGTEINDLLICAVAMAVNKLTGQKYVAIEMEGHGREDIHRPIEIDRTVGWFTSIYPVVVNVKKGINENIIETKEMLRKVPNHGIGYGVLKHLKDDLLGNTDADIMFNYLGELDSVMKDGSYFKVSQLPKGLESSEDNNSKYGITLNCSILDGELRITILFDRSRYSELYISKFALYTKEMLEELIHTCINQTETVKTASDFGTFDIEQDVLDELADLFND